MQITNLNGLTSTLIKYGFDQQNIDRITTVIQNSVQDNIEEIILYINSIKELDKSQRLYLKGYMRSIPELIIEACPLFNTLSKDERLNKVYSILEENNIKLNEDGDYSLRKYRELAEIVFLKTNNITYITAENAYLKEGDTMFEDIFNDIEEISYETQFNSFNEIFGGLHKGSCVYVAGESNCGKSLLVYQMMVHQAVQGKIVGIYNTDMSVKKLVLGYLHPMYIRETGNTNMKDFKHFISDKCRILHCQNEPIDVLPNMIDDSYDFLIIDLINSCQSTVCEDEYSKLEYIANIMKNIRNSYNTTVIGIAALNKTNSGNIDMNSIKGNNNAVYAMDEIILLNEIEQQPSHICNGDKMIEIKVGKSRNGATVGDTIQLLRTKDRGFVEENNSIKLGLF